MDETLLWLDMPRETTVTHTNDRSVPSWTELGVITVAYSKNGWMNENLTKDWLGTARVPDCLQLSPYEYSTRCG